MLTHRQIFVLSLVVGGDLVREKKGPVDIHLFSFPKYLVIDHLLKPFDQVPIGSWILAFQKHFHGRYVEEVFLRISL